MHPFKRAPPKDDPTLRNLGYQGPPPSQGRSFAERMARSGAQPLNTSNQAYAAVVKKLPSPQANQGWFGGFGGIKRASSIPVISQSTPSSQSAPLAALEQQSIMSSPRLRPTVSTQGWSPAPVADKHFESRMRLATESVKRLQMQIARNKWKAEAQQSKSGLNGKTLGTAGFPLYSLTSAELALQTMAKTKAWTPELREALGLIESSLKQWGSILAQDITMEDEMQYIMAHPSLLTVPNFRSRATSRASSTALQPGSTPRSSSVPASRSRPMSMRTGGR